MKEFTHIIILVFAILNFEMKRLPKLQSGNGMLKAQCEPQSIGISADRFG